MADQKKTDVNLTPLYTDLNKFGNNGDYARAIKVAKKILQEAPNEVNAQKYLTVCYIQESEFTNALELIEKNAALAESMSFEKAYCLYRLNKTQEALVILNKEPNFEPKHKELKAQILYRLEKFNECFDLYKDLIKNTQDDYEAERETNLSAVVACLSMEGTKVNFPIETDDSYELCYNDAIRLMGEGKYSEAEAQLRQAEAICRKSLEEDGAAEDEIEDELALIRTQLGYTTQLLGRTAESQQLYQTILKQKPSDIALQALAANNSAVINGAQNVFDSRRKLKLARTIMDENAAKFTSKQKQLLSVNQCLFLGSTAQTEQCKKAMEQLKKDHPNGLPEILLLQAAIEFKANKMDEALATLASAKSEFSLTAGLAALQFLLEKKEYDRAIRHLEDMLKKDFKLGLLGSLVSLHNARGERDRAVALVKQAMDKFSKTKGENQAKLLRQAAAFHLKGGEPDKAAECLEQLLKLEPNDTTTLARLVLLYSQFDPATAQKKSQQLPPLELDTGVGAIDVDALESTTWSLGLKHTRKGPTTGGLTSPGSAGVKKVDDLAKKKKKKKIRLPKHYDPKVQPDPERWLPRRERSTYRPKKVRDRRRRDVRADVGKGTQGTSAALKELENQYDMSNVKAGGAKAAATAAAAAAASPSTKSIPAVTSDQRSKGQSQKKKNRKNKY